MDIVRKFEINECYTIQDKLGNKKRSDYPTENISLVNVLGKYLGEKKHSEIFGRDIRGSSEEKNTPAEYNKYLQIISGQSQEGTQAIFSQQSKRNYIMASHHQHKGFGDTYYLYGSLNS